MLKGELPWQGLRARNKEEKYQKIKECKINTPIESLCLGYPEEMATYMNYCRNLQFEEAPNYAYLRRLFRDLYNKCCFENDFIYDWTIQRYRVELPQHVIDEQRQNADENSSKPESLKGNIGAGSLDADAILP